MFEELSRPECLSLLATVPVGRVGVSIGALPAILPVNFVMSGERLIFRTVPGTKLDAATARTVVAFQADSFDEHGSWGWSVLVRGTASEVTDPAELETLQGMPITAWAFADSRANRFVQIQASVVTGRRFWLVGAVDDEDRLDGVPTAPSVPAQGNSAASH